MTKIQMNQYLVDKAIDDITTYLVQDYKLRIDQAIDFIYNSDTYQKLTNPQTGLYVQSPAYIYQLLENEYKTGKLE
jgi:hypothetical protein